METLIQRGMWLCRFDDAFKLGHYPISEVDGRSHGDLVGGKGLAGPLSSLFRSVFGLAIGDPSLAGPFFLAEVGWLKMIRSVFAAEHKTRGACEVRSCFSPRFSPPP